MLAGTPHARDERAFVDVAQSDNLLKAVFEDNADQVHGLIAAGTAIAADPRHGNTPLRMACQSNSTRALRALLENGANPNERITYRSPVDDRVEQDFTPLMYADSAEIIDLLVKFGADVDAVSADGLSALMRFAHFGRAEAVAALLSHGADVSLRQHKGKGRQARCALEFAEDSLAFWESLPREQQKPEARLLIEEHRRTVDLLRKASAS